MSRRYYRRHFAFLPGRHCGPSYIYYATCGEYREDPGGLQVTVTVETKDRIQGDIHMSDFYQTGAVATLHKLGKNNLEELESRLMRYAQDQAHCPCPSVSFQ